RREERTVVRRAADPEADLAATAGSRWSDSGGGLSRRRGYGWGSGTDNAPSSGDIRRRWRPAIDLRPAERQRLGRWAGPQSWPAIFFRTSVVRAGVVLSTASRSMASIYRSTSSRLSR